MANGSLALAVVGWALVLAATGCVQPSPESPTAGGETKATILYSAAPWDDLAYELRVPLKAEGEASQPTIRINVWGNPEFEQPKTLQFSSTDDPMKIGRAIYQPIIDDSLPEALTGTVTFDRLKKGAPVSGNYDLATAKGRTFRGRFLAEWGNTPLPYIR